ncbi:MAG: tryptophan 7-halogenase, partial [Gammaproteobacteria bacterium]|nr:tryptophan 7-halogenase [Gammaproteobacteria bacterium]
MNRPTRTVVVVGGGTAGWITANRIAAEYPGGGHDSLRVVLVESPDIPTIGVGEGTWPSMRSTLQSLGLSEDKMIRATDASFKQGTRFFGWA